MGSRVRLGTERVEVEVGEGCGGRAGEEERQKSKSWITASSHQGCLDGAVSLSARGGCIRHCCHLLPGTPELSAQVRAVWVFGFGGTPRSVRLRCVPLQNPGYYDIQAQTPGI